MRIEFLKDWKDCNRKGDTREVAKHFGAVLIETGFAKAVGSPPRHKMIESPEKEKRHYYVG